ncbi:hypothetical protein [Cohnella soli]|uniref:Copper amine oxidase-like N-terminal domain-containing protein n=1 Tax=Cohnella soli TaxID=425005 RepID=A0ABW0HTW4_9BACL
MKKTVIILALMMFVLILAVPASAASIKSYPLLVDGKRTNNETVLSEGIFSSGWAKVSVADRIAHSKGKLNTKNTQIAYKINGKTINIPVKIIQKQPYVNIGTLGTALGYDSFIGLENWQLIRKVKPALKTIQYGQGTFDPKGFYPDWSTQTYFYEQGDYLYFFWNNDTGSSFSKTPGYSNLYVSIAKKGKWIVTDKVVYNYEDSNKTPEFQFMKNTVFVLTKDGVQALNVTETGDTKVTDLNTGPLGTVLPIYSANSYGIMVQSDEKTVKVYLANNYSKPITIQNDKGILNEFISWGSENRFYYLNEKSNLLYIFGMWDARFYDIIVGDMIYDKEGKDKTINVQQPDQVYNGKFVSVKGNSYYAYDLNLNPTFQVNFAFAMHHKKGLGMKEDYTLNGTEVHYWVQSEFKRQVSLDMESFKL